MDIFYFLVAVLAVCIGMVAALPAIYMRLRAGGRRTTRPPPLLSAFTIWYRRARLDSRQCSQAVLCVMAACTFVFGGGAVWWGWQGHLYLVPVYVIVAVFSTYAGSRLVYTYADAKYGP